MALSYVSGLFLRSTFAATAPRSAVAELGVVRRRYAQTMNRTILALGLATIFSHAIAGEQAIRPALNATDPERERAFDQEAAADVVAVYSRANHIRLYRPEINDLFTSEAAFLDYLKARKEPKRFLVVILSKTHQFADPKQTTDGFWQACKNTGFEHVSIQKVVPPREILRE